MGAALGGRLPLRAPGRARGLRGEPPPLAVRLGAQYRRIAARRGAKRAAVAVAHSILVIVYHILTRHEPYHDLGVTYFDERDRQAVERRLVKRLQALGYDVALRPLTAA